MNLTRKIIDEIELDQINPIVKVIFWLDNEENNFEENYNKL